MATAAIAGTPPAAISRKTIPSLDGFRAVAIVSVIGAHLLGSRGFNADELGSFGVRVFFVLSGYLITRLLLAELEKNGKINLAQFYLRRTLRIFPAFYCFLLFLAVLSALGTITLNPHDLLQSFTYTVNYFPFDSQSVFVRHIWSLSNEEQFYLLWPLCLVWAGTRKAVWILFAVVLSEPIVRFAIISAGAPLALTVDRRFDCLADTLATGCLLAVLSKPLSNFQPYLRFLRSRWVLLALPLIVAGARSAAHPRIYYVVSQTVMNVCIAVCIDRWVRNPEGPFGRFLNHPIPSRIGVMSYSLYLWQQPFLGAIAEWWNDWPVNLFLAIAAATGSFYLIEQPFQRLKNKVAARRPKPLPTRAA